MREIVRVEYSGGILLTLLLVSTTLALGRAQGGKENSNKDSAPVSEIHQMFIDDQADRHGFSRKEHSPEEIQKMVDRDAKRLKRTREIYYSGGLKSARDYLDASLLFQHSSTPDDYLLAHVLSVVAISMENKDVPWLTDARWLSAATLDRYLQSIKQKQVFGTQYSKNDKQMWIYDEYDDALLTDAIRKALNVPEKAEQQKDLESMNAPAQDKGQ
jgi:hypothetical protein